MSNALMKNRYQKKPEAEAVTEEVRKERLCLMCHSDFMSGWSGERICPRCRSKAAWREGHGLSGSGTS